MCTVYYDCNTNGFKDCITDAAMFGDDSCQIPGDCTKTKEHYCGFASLGTTIHNRIINILNYIAVSCIVGSHKAYMQLFF